MSTDEPEIGPAMGQKCPPNRARNGPWSVQKMGPGMAPKMNQIEYAETYKTNCFLVFLSAKKWGPKGPPKGTQIV